MAIASTSVVGLLHTPWSTVLLGKVTGSQLVKKSPALYGTRWFITAFTSVGKLYLFWTTSIQSIPPHPTSWRSILVLSYVYIHAWVFQVVLSLRFPHQNTVYDFPLPIRATCPPISFFSIWSPEKYWVRSSSSSKASVNYMYVRPSGIHSQRQTHIPLFLFLASTVVLYVITPDNKFLLTLCFWRNSSHFLLIVWRWAQIWQWKLKIDYDF